MAREVVRLFTGMYAARGASSGLRACVLCQQCRTMSTEAVQEPPTSLVERRAASSWSGSTGDRSVTRERSGPGLLQRKVPDRAANGAESTRDPLVTGNHHFIDTHAMVKTLEDGGERQK